MLACDGGEAATVLESVYLRHSAREAQRVRKQLKTGCYKLFTFSLTSNKQKRVLAKNTIDAWGVELLTVAV